MNTDIIVKNCDNFEEYTNVGKEWIQINIPKEESNFPILEINKYLRKLNQLKNASLERPTIAVFGASQVGKSYLISNLVKSQDENDLKILNHNEGDDNISFLREINPPGNRESTGTVTRFTTNSNCREYGGYKVRLFSPRDVICVIANGFYQDIKEHNNVYSDEKLNNAFRDFNKIKQKKETGIISESDVLDIYEYLYERLKLGSNTILYNLKQHNFWAQAASIAPFLPTIELCKLVSFLWSNNPFFDKLFELLLNGLKSVGYQKNIVCTKDLLTPSEKTILDIIRVSEIFNADKDNVTVRSFEGREYSIDRNILAALTVEVELPLAQETLEDNTKSYLKYADVLDFPGARSREHISEQVFNGDNEKSQIQVFLRGKVAYLFDMYNKDFGISTLLYCMHHKPQEVQTIPALLYGWLSVTLGTNPSERKERIDKLTEILKEYNVDISVNPLLVVMTMFDEELKGKMAEKLGDASSHDYKWNARLQENFIKFLHGPLRDKWLTDWAGDDAPTFKNTFTLRNPLPEYSLAIFDLDKDNKEIAVRNSMVEKLRDMRQSFIGHNLVRSHFHAPSIAWDEIAQPQKTGVEYIIKYLTPTCRPEIKRALILAEIIKTENEIIQILKPYYNPESADEQLKIARQKGVRAFMHFNRNVRDDFGHLLEKIQVTEDEAWATYQQIQNSALVGDADEHIETVGNFPIQFSTMLESYGININSSSDEIISELIAFFGLETKDELNEAVLEETGKHLHEIFGEGIEKEKEIPKDIPMYYTDKVLGIWIDKLNLVKSQNKENALSLTITELIKSKNRIGLREILYQTVKEDINNYQYSNRKFQKVSKLTFQTINNFVNTFGWHYVEESKRPKLKDEERSVFTIKEVDYTSIEPSIDIKFPLTSMMKDWVEGARAAFTSNVHFEMGIKDADALAVNQELGKILNNLETLKNEL